MESNLEKQEFLERFTQESKASKILGKRIKQEVPLQANKSRFIGSRIKEYFNMKLEEKEMLLKKKEMLKKGIADLVLVKENHLKLMEKINSQKQEINKRIRTLKMQLGDHLNMPLDSKTRQRMKKFSLVLTKNRKNKNTQIKENLKNLREKTKTEILADPEYELLSEKDLKEDIESNIYPSNLEFSRFYNTDSQIKILKNFSENNLILYIGKDSFLRVIDWKSLRILGLIRINTSKPVINIFLNTTSTDNSK
jgi:hypothetical protein